MTCTYTHAHATYTTYATTVTSDTDKIVGIGGVADAADDVLSDARAVRVDPSLRHGSLQ